MASLTNDQRSFIVVRLACYASPSEVRDELRDGHGVEVGLDQVVYYDPATASGARLGEKWRALFDETREAYKREIERVPIANKVYRLNRLQRLLSACVEVGEELAVLEQAAKEAGDVYVKGAEAGGQQGSEVQAVLMQIEAGQVNIVPETDR